MMDEVLYNAAQASMRQYEQEYEVKRAQLVEAQNTVKLLEQEVERIRGGYTSLYNLCKSFVKGSNVTEQTVNSSAVKTNKSIETEQSNNNVKEVKVEKPIEEVKPIKEKEDTSKLLDNKKPEASETTKLTPEQIAKVSQTLNETKSSAPQASKTVKQNDIPDYLKPEYNKK